MKYPSQHSIFLLQTGGTIGSTITDGTIDVDSAKGDALIQTYLDTASRPVVFDVARPFTILSENALPGHWSQIIQALKAVDFSAYQGIIVTHGSDTLPYTAAALSYFFATSPIPIVLVCADHPLGHPESNALPNFSAAVDFILTSGLPGIFVVYQNSNADLQIHLGTRLLEADWIHDHFQSFGHRPFMKIDGHCLSHGGAELTPSAAQLKNRKLHTNWGPVPTFDREILALRAYPGLNYQYLDLQSQSPAAVLHALYHCGSGNTAGPEHYSLKTFIQENPQCDHYLLSYKDPDGDLYATCRELIDAGGIPLKNMCFEAALTKLFFAYNQDRLSPSDYMQHVLFFESL